MNRFTEDPAPLLDPAPEPTDSPEPQAAPDVTPPPGVHAMRRRHAHGPIIAEYHPTGAERLGATLRAHKFGIAATVALLVLLVLGIIGTTAGMMRAARQRDAALAARAEAERLRAAAESRQREATAVSGFLEAVLGSVNPWGADRASEVSVEQMLDAAAAKLDDGLLRGQKEGEARVRATLGVAYAGLALPGRAEPQLRRAMELQRDLHPRGDHAEVARVMNVLSSVLLSFGPRKADEAEQLATAGLEMRRRLFGPEHKEVADSLDAVSAVCLARRDYFTAERRADEAVAMRRRLPPELRAKSGLALSLTNRAMLLWRKGEVTATIRDLREAMDNYRGEIPDDHLHLGVLHSRLGAAHFAAGNRPEAVRHFRQAIDIRRKHRPESHGDIAEPFRRLVVMLWEQDEFDAAEKLLKDREARLGAINDCPPEPTSEVCGQFVGLYQAWGKPEQAALWGKRTQESLAREVALATAQIERRPNQARPYADRAKLRVRAGQFKDAAADFSRAIAIDPADHWPWYYHGCLLAYLGDEPAYKAHCAQMVQRFGSAVDGHLLDCTVKTCSLLPNGAGGDPERLNQIANQVWALGSKDERNVAWFRLLKGMAEYRAGGHERAINWLTASLQPALPHRSATGELYLAMAYHRMGKTDDARAALARAEDRVQRLTPKPGVGDLAEGGIENWLICQTALREARAVVGK